MKKDYRKAIFLFFLGTILLIWGLSVGGKIETWDRSTLKGSIPRARGSGDSIKEVGVAKVLDGDTIETSLGERVRYIGINSPEKGEAFSSQATEFNKALVLGKNVSLEFDIQAKDRYGRTLAYVFVDNALVNIEILKKGLAVLQTVGPNVKYQDSFVKAQKEAYEKCFGIWQDVCSLE